MYPVYDKQETSLNTIERDIFRQQMLNDSILESFGKSEERTTYFTNGIIFISFEIKAIFSEIKFNFVFNVYKRSYELMNL